MSKSKQFGDIVVGDTIFRLCIGSKIIIPYTVGTFSISNGRKGERTVTIIAEDKTKTVSGPTSTSMFVICAPESDTVSKSPFEDPMYVNWDDAQDFLATLKSLDNKDPEGLYSNNN